MKPKKIFGVYLLNIFIFLFLSVLCFALLVQKGEAARLLFLNQELNLLPRFLYSLNPGFIAFVTLLLQVMFTAVINRQYLQTKKQIVLVNVSVLITFLVLAAAQLVPVIIRREYCSAVILSEREEVGRCMTFMENSRAAVVYIIAIFYVFWYTANALWLQLFLLLTKDKLKIAFFGLLALVINGAIFMLLFSGQKAMINKNNIQVKPFPSQIAPAYQLEINGGSQLLDPNVRQLQEVPAVTRPPLNLENKN